MLQRNFPTHAAIPTAQAPYSSLVELSKDGLGLFGWICALLLVAVRDLCRSWPVWQKQWCDQALRMTSLCLRRLCGGASRVFLPRGQQRHVVARASQVALESRGPLKQLRDDVAMKFARAAQGSPPNISSGQLVQILFEVGVADVRTQTVGEVVNFLMQHGFYRQTHPQKRDSYGPVPPPTLGLMEAQRWATLMFFKGMQPKPKPSQNAMVEEAPPRPICGSTWCPCPPGATGTDLCALAKKR